MYGVETSHYKDDKIIMLCASITLVLSLRLFLIIQKLDLRNQELHKR